MSTSPSAPPLTEFEPESKVQSTNEGEQNPIRYNIKIRNANGEWLQFKIKPHVPLQKLFQAYCNRTGTDAGSIVFLYNGERLDPTLSAEENNLEDDDEIDAMIQMTGGEGRKAVWRGLQFFV